ncbi:hypothetical protein NC653_040294 [Populus alba x Populus x berolinensis]|uniref:Uncharacterized protein n=1 Tax=Populus alba x Populus x berolinensis TaxID=444605 RepID=A0AAD6LFY7_9ROSI|nr:hypothetical protein NC653_040294 [Populus alba x Populus x berolinensis]
MERVKAQEEHEEQSNQNWSETVEDLSVEKEDEISKCNVVSNDGHLEKSSNPRDDVSPCSDDAKPLFSLSDFKSNQETTTTCLSISDGECFHKGDLARTVGPYDRNVFLCFKNPDAWLPHVEEDDLPKFVSTALKTRKDDITVKTKAMICEGGEGAEFENRFLKVYYCRRLCSLLPLVS